MIIFIILRKRYTILEAVEFRSFLQNVQLYISHRSIIATYHANAQCISFARLASRN